MPKLAWVIKPEFLMGEREDVNLCSSSSAVTENYLLTDDCKTFFQQGNTWMCDCTSISEKEAVTLCARSKTPLEFRSQIPVPPKPVIRSK